MMLGLGRLQDPPDERDYAWRSVIPQSVAKVLELPDAFYRPDPGPVLMQGDDPFCVAYTGSSIKMEHEFREMGLLFSFDPNPLYARCKELDGIPDQDGTYPRVMLGILKNEGVKAENGNFYKIADYVRLTSTHQIKEALFLDGPVAFGITIDTAWEQVSQSGVISKPSGQTLGGHAVTIFGWNDHMFGRYQGGLYLKNSWDSTWGAGGYGCLPYEHLEAYPDFDAWKVIDIENIANVIAPAMQ